MKMFAFTPSAAGITQAAAFMEETLLAAGCPAPVVMKMCVAADELLSNIALYSGASEASIACGVANGAAVLVLRDNGAPYDPTARSAPDITLSAAERAPGGLGIHMVKRLMSEMRYRLIDGQNELTVTKDFTAAK